jgi:CHAT domain-containing protein
VANVRVQPRTGNGQSVCDESAGGRRIVASRRVASARRPFPGLGLLFGALLVAEFLAHPTVGLAGAADRSRAEELRHRALDRIEAFREHVRKTGNLTARVDDLRQAVEGLEQAYRAFRAAGQVGEAAACRVDAGDAARLQNKSAEAQALYVEGEVLARAAGESAALARALTGQARLRLEIKDPNGAEVQADEAIRVGSPLPDKAALLEALILRCDVEQAQGDWAAAAYWITRALLLAPEVGNNRLSIASYLDRHFVSAGLSKMYETDPMAFDLSARAAGLARDDAREAMAIAKRCGWIAFEEQCAGRVRAAEIRARLVEMQRKYQEMLLQKLPCFNPVKPSDVIVSERFAPDKENSLRLVLDLPREWMGGDDADGHYIRASVSALSGEGDAALAGFLRAVERLEADRRQLRDDESRNTLLEDRVTFYFRPIRHLLDRKRYDEAFGLLEASRARVLLDLLVTKQQAVFAKEPERALFVQMRELRAQIATRQKTLFGQRLRAGPGAPKDADLERQIDELEDRYARVLQQIRVKAPNLQRLVSAEVVPLATVRAMAEEGGFDVLEYLVVDEGIIVWHVGKSGVHIQNVFLPHAQLWNKIKTLREGLEQPGGDFDATTARQLFLFLVQPVLGDITTDHLVVIPHEELYYLPFQVLQDPTGRFVAERFRVSYAPSATVLRRLPAGGPLADAKVLAVAGPGLTAAAGETEAIARLYPGGSKLIPVELATERLIRELVGSYTVLHAACHGKFIEREPLLSHLELTPHDPDDGRLTAAEMFALPLEHVRLVTLSACETGRIRGTHAGEVIGMQRALLHAGAPAMLLSSWKIDSESTALWMTRFYQEAARVPLPEAARRAALEVKAKFAHPYYWAAFYLVGR